MEFELSERLKTIPPYAFAAISSRVRELELQGKDIIRLDMGSPDMPPPPAVVEALYESARQPNHHGYAGFAGIPRLREAFSAYYSRRFGVSVDAETEVLPLIGSKEGIVHLNLAFLDPGDVVLIPDPAYPSYERGARLADAEPYFVRLDPENRFQPDLNVIPANILARAKMMWVNYPNNPTGAVATLEDYEQIVAFCKSHDILLCSDNPYAEVSFDGVDPPSVLCVAGAKESAVEFNSLSKAYNMAGWRVGACVGNSQVVQGLLHCKSNVDSGMFRAVMEAAIVALNETDQDWIEERNTIYSARRDVILEALPSIGLAASVPPASLYVWAKVPGGDDKAYCADVLENAHVSMVPGSVYGEMGRGYLRMSIVQEVQRIREAMGRVAAWYNTSSFV